MLADIAFIDIFWKLFLFYFTDQIIAKDQLKQRCDNDKVSKVDFSCHIDKVN